jgi:putative SOS response-associated peptidase YedK
MCGRFTLTVVDPGAIAQRFAVGDGDPFAAATLERFNVCPTERIAAVCGPEPQRSALAPRWGLVPPWARALGDGPEPINARAETVADRRPFAALLPRADRRCLVVADGWYEWLRPERKGEPRVPFRYTVDGGAPFAFAGLYDVRRVGGEEVVSATILTTAANAVCAPVHDRMPCVLGGLEEEAGWLSGELDAAALAELLVPLDAARTSAAPASPAVNRAGAEGAELLAAPAEPEPAPQLTLGL